MKKKLIITSIISLTLLNCKKEQDPFQISKHHIGLLTDSTQVKDLETIYANDSIAKHISGDEFIGNINDIDIYDKLGSKLLTLTPSQALDSTATIKNVHIYDNRFKTDRNISKLSTFKDIQDNYKISSIDNLISSVLVSVNEINASFSIDKKELPANLRFDMNLEIEATHIPDGAKIKYFMINWN